MVGSPGVGCECVLWGGCCCAGTVGGGFTTAVNAQHVKRAKSQHRPQSRSAAARTLLQNCKSVSAVSTVHATRLGASQRRTWAKQHAYGGLLGCRTGTCATACSSPSEFDGFIWEQQAVLQRQTKSPGFKISISPNPNGRHPERCL